MTAHLASLAAPVAVTATALGALALDRWLARRGLRRAVPGKTGGDTQ